MSIQDFTLERLCAITEHLLHLRFPTMKGAMTAETMLNRWCAESSLTLSAWLASISIIRSGAWQTIIVTVISSSTHASIAQASCLIWPYLVHAICMASQSHLMAP